MWHRTQRPPDGSPAHRSWAWRKLRLHILERDQWTCRMPVCVMPSRMIPETAKPRTRPSASVDLIVPLALGGSDRDETNLRAAHYACNSRAGNDVRCEINGLKRFQPTNDKPRVITGDDNE